MLRHGRTAWNAERRFQGQADPPRLAAKERDAQAAFQVPIVFAGLLVLAALGILLYAATALVEQRFTGWAFRGQANR